MNYKITIKYEHVSIEIERWYLVNTESAGLCLKK